METQLQNYFCSYSKGIEQLESHLQQSGDTICLNIQELAQNLAESYIKLAFLIAEEVEKPIAIMKKMIRKPLKSRAKPKKPRTKSISTQNTETDGVDIFKSVSLDEYRN